MTSSEYILERIAAGDPTAVADCMKKFSGLVWSLVRARLGNSPDAEDATQEIFIEIWKSAARFDPDKGSEAVFVATIARRRVIDRLRSQGRKPESEEFDETTMVTEDDDFGQLSADVRIAERAMSELQEDQRSLIVMGIVEGLTQSEIAAATGKPLGTVKTQMRRGLAKVRARMESKS